MKPSKASIQAEIKRKEQLRNISDVIEHLDRQNESYEVYYECDHLNWIHDTIDIRKKDQYRGIHGDFQINVQDKDALLSYTIEEHETDAVVSKEVSKLILKNQNVLVCYLVEPVELEISLNAFLNNPSVFFSRPETWILTEDKKWILEYLWDQGVIRIVALNQSEPKLIVSIRVT